MYLSYKYTVIYSLLILSMYYYLTWTFVGTMSFLIQQRAVVDFLWLNDLADRDWPVACFTAFKFSMVSLDKMM